MTDTRSALQIRRDMIAREKAEHTPGPWTFRRAITSTDGGFDYGIDAIVKGKKRYIAEAFEVVGNGVKVDALANARLIAAAPETAAERDRLKAVNAAMLAALKAVESITRDLPLPSVHNVINHAITAASEEMT